YHQCYGCSEKKPRILYFFFQAEDGIRDRNVTGVQTCALPISPVLSATRTRDSCWITRVLLDLDSMCAGLPTRRTRSCTRRGGGFPHDGGAHRTGGPVRQTRTS